jgi:hypothetical protein
VTLTRGRRSSRLDVAAWQYNAVPGLHNALCTDRAQQPFVRATRHRADCKAAALPRHSISRSSRARPAAALGHVRAPRSPRDDAPGQGSSASRAAGNDRDLIDARSTAQRRIGHIARAALPLHPRKNSWGASIAELPSWIQTLWTYAHTRV